MLHQQNIKTFLSCHYSSKRLCHSAPRHRGPSLWCVMSRCDDNPRNEHKLQRWQQQHTNILTLCTWGCKHSLSLSRTLLGDYSLAVFHWLGLFSALLCNQLGKKERKFLRFFFYIYISPWFNVKFCFVFSKTKHLILQLVGEPLLHY